MIRNTAGQTWEVEARWQTGAPYLGGAATLTAKLSKDGGTYTSTTDTNPTELESGRYAFSLTQAETDALALTLLPVCSVAGVIVRAVPQSQITTPTAWSDATLAKQDDILAAIAGITGGSGGAFAQTVTVTNATTHAAIPNATVQILSGEVIKDRKNTNGSGVAVPSVDAGSYDLLVTVDGFESSGKVPITVAAAAARAVELTPITIPVATDPGTVTGYLRLYSGACVPEPGAALSVQQYSPTAQAGFDSEVRTWTADGNGDASGPLWIGEWYHIRRGTGEWSEPFTVVDSLTAPGTMNLYGILGTP